MGEGGVGEGGGVGRRWWYGEEVVVKRSVHGYRETYLNNSHCSVVNICLSLKSRFTNMVLFK